ncbi:phosphoglycerate mutase [Caballeronia hypogeia]|uniref:Phosphoglycerate mutase n=1 Tax=Caballeronia hypogeia TaxID=1777140 RepID=A0A158B4J5_9BURK|nr:histidine phosphatase family protein [Caballeronia hypogeia]SAK65058.1 phosphoglycerate mutase [Caballeronia hypogeia]
MDIILLCHAATRAMKTGRFPTGDEPAEYDARAQVRAQTARVISGPARVARDTAGWIARSYEIIQEFDDIDYGRWRGQSIREVGEREQENMAAWLTDPHARPHGGESIAMLAARVPEGIARIVRIQNVVPRDRCIVVTHAIVVKVLVALAIGKPLSSVYAMNFAPLSSSVLSVEPETGAWTVGLPQTADRTS